MVVGMEERLEDNDEIATGIEPGRARAGSQEESIALRGIFGRDPFRSLQVPFIFLRKPPPEPLPGVCRPEVIFRCMILCFCVGRCAGKDCRQRYSQHAVKGEARGMPALERDIN